MSQEFSVKLAHHHTAICVSHWETSVAFYQQLGFVVANDWYWPDGVENHKSLLRFGDKSDCWLELFEYPEGRGKLTEAYTKPSGCVFHFALETVYEKAVDELYAFALSAGGGEAQAPREICFQGTHSSWGIRQATVSGPDGELISFVFDRGGM